mmetsp:Transcript_20373/g.48100  ORF Transcript_20373/g.48100 Transcript_20373/m.48100 type:complete len:221 (-) Transcript_20373:1475-2137(-)
MQSLLLSALFFCIEGIGIVVSRRLRVCEVVAKGLLIVAKLSRREEVGRTTSSDWGSRLSVGGGRGRASIRSYRYQSPLLVEQFLVGPLQKQKLQLGEIVLGKQAECMRCDAIRSRLALSGRASSSCSTILRAVPSRWRSIDFCRKYRQSSIQLDTSVKLVYPDIDLPIIWRDDDSYILSARFEGRGGDSQRRSNEAIEAHSALARFGIRQNPNSGCVYGV